MFRAISQPILAKERLVMPPMKVHKKEWRKVVHPKRPEPFTITQKRRAQQRRQAKRLIAASLSVVASSKDSTTNLQQLGAISRDVLMDQDAAVKPSLTNELLIAKSIKVMPLKSTPKQGEYEIILV
ncbi:hypothetical protein CDL15_Pgr001085 [Punica granatum]|uniref:Uncharacterized protein n=1 Tax=Punica granatum TaxID=22663 RepID=A0A218WL56_PUNGR|nr:hypothetical protein CDL15_Pgr001085 [Punica granatum]